MTTSKKSALISIFATLLSLVVLARSSAAQTYSAASDFSTAGNPNGAWSYGWSLGLGSSFVLDTSNATAYSGLGLAGWLGAQHADGIPYVLHNGTANPITLSSTTYQPGQLAEQSGESNQYCIVRWTAPSSGTFHIAATFSGLSSLGDSSDVHILLDGVSIFAADVGSVTNYSGLQSITAGDTIDFTIGNGGNGPEEDTTALSAIITVPEPGTLGLIAMGLGCLLPLGFRRRTQGNGRLVTSTSERSPSLPFTQKTTFISTAAALLCLAALTLPSTASAFSAAGDFSTASNPNGTWSYGWSSTLGSTFTLSTIPTNNYAGFGLDGWLGTSDSSGTPYVLHNGTASTVNLINSVYQPGQLGLNPGAQGQYAIVQWTAPSSGIYNIAATFSGLSSVGDSVDVHILHDGASIFNSTVGGSPAPTSYSGLQNITAGDTIDFAVGFGGNGNNFEDNTGLSAIITVPEPGAFGLVGMGFGCLLALRFLKQK